MNEQKKNVRSGDWSGTAGKPGFPLEFPAFLNGEALLVACDKTTPALAESRAGAAGGAR